MLVSVPVKYLRISGYVKKNKKNRDKGRNEERETEEKLQRHEKMSGLGMVTRACSTFHADTACPSCKIKRIHGALCRDQNSQAVRGIFLLPFRFRTKLATATVYIAFNIGPRGDVKAR